MDQIAEVRSCPPREHILLVSGLWGISSLGYEGREAIMSKGAIETSQVLFPLS